MGHGYIKIVILLDRDNPSEHSLVLMQSHTVLALAAPSSCVGVLRPPYFFQYIQHDAHSLHCMLGGPQAYHCGDWMAGAESMLGLVLTRAY